MDRIFHSGFGKHKMITASEIIKLSTWTLLPVMCVILILNPTFKNALTTFYDDGNQARKEARLAIVQNPEYWKELKMLEMWKEIQAGKDVVVPPEFQEKK